MNLPIQDLLKDAFYFPQLGVTIETKNVLDDLLTKLFLKFDNDPKQILTFLERLNKDRTIQVVKKIIFSTVLTEEDKKNLGTELSIDEVYDLMKPDLKELPEGQKPGTYNRTNSAKELNEFFNTGLLK